MAVSPGTDHIAYMAPEVIEYIYVEVQMGSGMQSYQFILMVNFLNKIVLVHGMDLQ